MTWQTNILWDTFRHESWLVYVKESTNGEVTVGVTDMSLVPVKLNALAVYYKVKLKIESSPV